MDKEILEQKILDYESTLYDLYNENCRYCEYYNNSISFNHCETCDIYLNREITIKILSELRIKQKNRK